MKKEDVWVISLGGSRIAPKKGKVDFHFIKKFEVLIEKHPDVKFVVVTGGGATARNYISALKKLRQGVKKQSEAGIAVTRFHASFLSRIFGRKANSVIPMNMKKVKSLLRKNQVVFSGALRYRKKQTSDGTAASIAAHLKSKFINLTDIKGIYTENPKTNKKARFIKKISWKNFEKMASGIKFKAGQHFVLDQDAARTILEKRIPTYIVGSLEDVHSIVSGESFKGSLVSG
jgi:uridylate kinase